jgi:hypothetical protein
MNATAIPTPMSSAKTKPGADRQAYAKHISELTAADE